jgi:hypothetical protein
VTALPSARVVSPAQRDFDFLQGRWTVHNRRLERPLDPDSTEWREFTMEVENRPLPGGLGNLDTYCTAEFPGQPEFAALALRLFDRDSELWRIWWVSSSSAGQLDTPVLGRFAGRHGRFECDDVLAGWPVKVRYEWWREASTPRWQQAFSFDGGRTWNENWLMEWHRR